MLFAYTSTFILPVIMRQFVFLLTVFALVPVSLGKITPNLSITVSDYGYYIIYVQNKFWLESAPTFFRSNGNTYTLANGTLVLKGRNQTSGSDVIGNWSKVTLTYLAGMNTIQVGVKSYKEVDCIVFSQKYINDTEGTCAGNYDGVVGGFPSFRVKDEGLSRGYLSYGGINLGSQNMKMGRWNSTADINDGISGGPLALFDDDDNCTLISPFSKFMAASTWYDSNNAEIYWGIMGGVNSIPAGYQYDTILVYNKGINKAFQTWGDILRKWYGRPDNLPDSDVTLNNLGYWTSKGAYYHDGPEIGKNYEETVSDIKAYMEKAKIPYNYFQYDSWWYYQGDKGCVKTWEPRHDVFPNGLSYVYSITQIPAALNIGYWSTDTSYAIQNNGKFSFLIGNNCSLPTEVDFWQFLFQTGEKWKMVLFQQDWLDVESTCLDYLMTNLDLGRRWMMDMREGNIKTKCPIQFSRAYPRHAMQALEIPNVTQAKVSDDYSPGGDNWKIGLSSILAHALRIAPFKGTFWTTSSQPDFEAIEPYPALHALVATLSTGPVGPGDSIGSTNVTLLNRCCSTGGMILKPNKPAMALDRQIRERVLNGNVMELWATSTDYDAIIPGTLRFGTVFAVDTPSNFVITSKDLDFIDTKTEYMVFEYNNPDNLFKYNHTTGLQLPKCTREAFCLYHFTPKFIANKNREMYLLGEVNKWVPISPKRIATVSVDGPHAILEMYGEVGEVVTISVLMDGKIVTFTCTMGPSGSISLWMIEGDCEP